MEDRTPCRTPAEGRDGVTNIPTWKFELVRQAILDAVWDQDLAFADLREAVRARLDPADLDRLGSLGWHVTTVKLELEVRGEISRRTQKGRQVLTLGR